MMNDNTLPDPASVAQLLTSFYLKTVRPQQIKMTTDYDEAMKKIATASTTATPSCCDKKKKVAPQ